MAGALQIFINYRRDDTWGEALLLHDRLGRRFGPDNVFLDTEDLEPGLRWLEEIKKRSDASGVFLSLIGARWLAALKARELEGTDDYVRVEIEYALQRQPPLHVIPVLIGDAVAPLTERLPRSLWPLVALQAAQVRRATFEADVARLIARLEPIALEPVPQPPPPPPVVKRRPRFNRIAPPPNDEHYEMVLERMTEVGTVVPLLGTRINPADHAGSKSLYPDGEELAMDLAERFGVEIEPPDLAQVAQYVYTASGRPDLFRTLKQILTAAGEPGPVHRFLAGFPRTLRDQGREPRYQLIISTAFDMALERAFDEASEPYDLAVYMRETGKFMHFPYGGEPELITLPNAYGKLPIGDYGDLERTLIVKIHGTVDGNLGAYRWRENYVITEDHYIDYLSRSSVENLVPVQILDKLRDSHCLFLGYTVRDWNLRVFLKRIWHGERLGAKSWAIEREADVLEREFWAQSYVDLYTSELGDYVAELQARLTAPHEPPGQLVA
jgi:hypothetical protein